MAAVSISSLCTTAFVFLMLAIARQRCFVAAFLLESQPAVRRAGKGGGKQFVRSDASLFHVPTALQTSKIDGTREEDVSTMASNNKKFLQAPSKGDKKGSIPGSTSTSQTKGEVVDTSSTSWRKKLR